MVRKIVKEVSDTKKTEAEKLASKIKDELSTRLFEPKAEPFTPGISYCVSVRGVMFTSEDIRKIEKIIKDFEVERWEIFKNEEGLLELSIK